MYKGTRYVPLFSKAAPRTDRQLPRRHSSGARMGARLCVCVFATIRATQTGLLTLRLRPFRPPPYSGSSATSIRQAGRVGSCIPSYTDRGVSRVGGGRAWGAWWGVASRAIPMRHGYPLIARKGRAGARASPRGSLVIGVLLKVLRWRTRPWRHPTYEGWCVVIPQPGQSALNPIRRPGAAEYILLPLLLLAWPWRVVRNIVLTTFTFRVLVRSMVRHVVRRTRAQHDEHMTVH